MPLVVLIIVIVCWKLRPVREISSTASLPRQRLTPFQRSQRPFWLVAGAAMLSSATFHQPTVSLALPQRQTAAVNVAFVLDLSGSMDASDWTQSSPPPASIQTQDLPPSRLATAKEHLDRLLAQAHAQHLRTALVAFADEAVLISPLADRHDTLRQRLQHLRTDQLQDGTRIGIALQTAIRALKHAPNGPKIIVLLSDGVDHTEDTAASPLQAAQEAAAQHITLHAVAIGGSHAFHPVTTPEGAIRHEARGEPLDTRQLTSLTQAARGQLFLAQDTAALATALSHIDTSLQQHAATHAVHRTVSLTPCLLLLAALLTFLALFLQARL